MAENENLRKPQPTRREVLRSLGIGAAAAGAGGLAASRAPPAQAPRMVHSVSALLVNGCPSWTPKVCPIKVS